MLGKFPILLVLLVIGTIVSASCVYATTWDATAQFNEVLPNGQPAVQTGPWLYGNAVDLSTGYTLTLFDYMDQNPGIDHWRDYWTGADVPAVLYNQTDSDGSFGQTVSAHTMAMHPGTNGEKAIVRWTAPDAGAYTITTSFWTLADATTDCNLLVNGSSLWSEYINSTSSVQSYTTTQTLAANATVDFALGFGENGTCSIDCTMFSATITSADVPEPGSLIALAGGLLSLGGLVVRRRK